MQSALCQGRRGGAAYCLLSAGQPLIFKLPETCPTPSKYEAAVSRTALRPCILLDTEMRTVLKREAQLENGTPSVLATFESY
eukprot:8601348-Pyramimonas_sp.AAC.1